MLYDIKLKVEYTFQTPAAGARQILHAMPLTIPGRQRLIAGSIDIDPQPAMRREREDFFGNRLSDIAFNEPHSKVVIGLKARVEVTGSAEPAAASVDLRALRHALDATTDLGPRSRCIFCRPRPMQGQILRLRIGPGRSPDRVRNAVRSWANWVWHCIGK
jgi:transglutaminase-like putative cysteine protease